MRNIVNQEREVDKPPSRRDIRLIKADSKGDKIWEKTFGGSSTEAFGDLQDQDDRRLFDLRFN